MTIKNISILFALLFLQIGYCQSTPNDWENQHVTQLNKEVPHASLFYDDASEDVTSLNGQWDFAWYSDVSEVPNNSIPEKWNRIEVPGA